VGRVTGALTVAVAMLCLGAAAAGAPALAGGVTVGAVFSSSDGTSLDYFLDPGDSTLTKDGGFNKNDFGSVSKTLTPASGATSPHGSASATASINATVVTFPDNLTSVSATGKISGTAKQNATAGTGPAFVDVPVASSDSSFSIDFSGTGVPMIIAVSGSASNSDADDCTEVDADFSASTQDGELNQSLVVAAKGGDCPSVDGKLSYTGVLTGSGSLNVQVGATVDPEDPGSESYSGSYTVSLSFPFGACTITGTSSAETLNGTSHADVICGMGGADTINGNAGNDVIVGGAGVDTINGGADDDVIHGADGADVIQGGSGDDAIFGELGGDLISDSAGPNFKLSGGDGEDAICGSNQKDTIDGGNGDDFVLGFGGADVITGGMGNDPGLSGEGSASEALVLGCTAPAGSLGTNLGDTISGGAGDDSLNGGPGDDLLKGEAGSDKLRGDAGADTLIGGTRKDVLNGGAGPDTLNACDGVLDTVIGGAAIDTAKIDHGIDDVHADVEIRHNC
jgi:Ca2+-binding RTX toxin-like protein